MIPNILKETMRGIQPVRIEDEMLLRREVFMTDTVTRESASDLIKQLMYLDRIGSGEPITLYINSPGGEVCSGLAVYDYIQSMQSPVDTVCVGSAASMGAILFLAGENRKMYRNSQIMIHDPSFSQGDIGGKKPYEIREELNKLMKTRETLAKIIAVRTGMPIELVYCKTKNDTFIGANEAIKTGIATEIISDRKRTLQYRNSRTDEKE